MNLLSIVGGRAWGQQAAARGNLPGQNLGGVAGGISEQPVVNQNPAVQIQQRPPLPEDQARYVRDVLNFWQEKTAKIQRFSCRFVKWEFNSALTGANFHYSAGEGELRYMKPDKGLYKVERLFTYVPPRLDKNGLPADPNAKPDYKELPGQHGDWWLCDGSSVHEYDRSVKEVRQWQLPPELQGMQIVDSPLPFVFGVDAVKVLDRYWIEPLAPPTGADGKPRQDLIVLNAFPKRLEDAENYQRVQIFLDRSSGLPQVLQVFKPNSEDHKPVYDHFEFSNQEIHDGLLDKIKERLWADSFIPAPPKDWKVIVKPYAPAGSGDLTPPQNAALQSSPNQNAPAAIQNKTAQTPPQQNSGPRNQPQQRTAQPANTNRPQGRR